MSSQKIWTVTSLLSKFGARAEQQWVGQMAGQPGLGLRHLSWRAYRGHPLAMKPEGGVGARALSLASALRKKGTEPHINDAKARPVEQGLRLDEIPTGNIHNPEPETEMESRLRMELSKASSESALHLLKFRDSEDKYLRALAETENVRNRLTKQIKEAKLFAIQSFCKDLTDIEDILRMAIESVPKDQLLDKNSHLSQLYEGVRMTDAQLLQVFKRHGLTQINPLNEKFNPNEHEAVVQQEVEGKESGTVIFVSKVGYKLNDRVIRPAVVGVAK